LGAQYVKRRGFTPGQILLGTKSMGPKVRGTLSPKLPPEIAHFHVKFKCDGRFGRAVRQKTRFREELILLGTKYMGHKFTGILPPKLPPK